MLRWVAGGVVVAVALLVGCASTDPAAPTAQPDRSVPSVTETFPAPSATAAAPQPGDTSTTVASTVPLLAPSQITASTVERPATPPPCHLDDLAMSTASIEPGLVGIRIRNVGLEWCDVDVSGSPRLDPLAEATIWLEAGGAATLVASEAEPGCGAPTLIRTIEFDVGGVGVFVPTALSACSWRVTALYPVDRPSAGCTGDQLTARWFDVEQLLVVAHAAGPACRLGDTGGELLERGDALVWEGERCSGFGDLPFDVPEIDLAGLPECVAWSAEPGGVAVVAPDLAAALADGSIDL